MVHRVVFLTNSGELPYGAAAGKALFRPARRRRPPGFPLRDLNHPIEIRRTRTEDTPSGVILLKNLRNQPAVLYAFSGLRFHFLKTYFRRFESNYAFQYLHNCH